MTITPLLPMQIHRARKRIRDLEALRRRIDAKIADLRDELAIYNLDLEENARETYKRGTRKPCGTEEGYQWHRHWEKDTNWPLPKDDPCGCRAAHRERERLRRLRAEIADRQATG